MQHIISQILLLTSILYGTDQAFSQKKSLVTKFTDSISVSTNNAFENESDSANFATDGQITDREIKRTKRPQSTDEQKIRQLETSWPLLLEKNDTTALKEILSEAYVVNNVNQQISTRRQILDLLKAGRVFPKVERTIERITFTGPVAVVMGSETEFPSKPQTQTTRRRFTNTWFKQQAGWKLIARQATNVCSNELKTQK